MNLLEAKLEKSGEHFQVRLGSQTLALDDEALAAHAALKAYAGREIIVGIRPEDMEDPALATGSPADRQIKGKVELTEALGSEIMVHFSIDATHAVTEDVHDLQKDAGTDRAPGAGLGAEGGGAVIVGRFGPRSRVKVGETISVAVDTRSLHFFDPETSLGIYG
jgi:multiple sugar transport system ATP-binding protein